MVLSIGSLSNFSVFVTSLFKNWAIEVGSRLFSYSPD